MERLLKTIPRRDDFQVIVIDDCSDKGFSKAQLSEIYPGILFLTTGSNGGPGIARNTALEYAEGRYVMFADADDFFTPCFEAAVEEYFEKDFDVVYFNANSVDSDSYQPSPRAADRNEIFASVNHLEPKAGVNRFEYLRYRFTTPWGKLIKRALIEREDIQFEESRVSEDVFFSTILDYHAHKVWGDSRCIYCLTFRSDSLSGPDHVNDSLEKLRIDCERYDFLVCVGQYASSFISHPSTLSLSPIAQHLHTIYRRDRSLWSRALEICRENSIEGFKAYRLLAAQSLRYHISRLIIKLIPNRVWRVMKNIDILRRLDY